ncbi:hypothetical protein PG985_005179 [Apiospora marii]|uniref:uncharacterized protein n=1 Tax=Apiospora marii TaxID=335849 RepID=UPI003131B1EF
MKFTQAIAIAALSSPVFSWAIFKTESRQGDVGCLTTNSSPAIEDVKACIDQLYDRGGDCPHGGTDCTTFVTQGSAAVKLCGAELQTTDLTCVQVSDYASQIEQMCQMNNLAEGAATVNASQRVVVGHS